jgi:hypothetical protein
MALEFTSHEPPQEHSSNTIYIYHSGVPRQVMEARGNSAQECQPHT